jgi:hypothetical protein
VSSPNRTTPQDEDLPEVHPGATGGLFARENFGFQQRENLGLERGVHPDPLQTGQDGRQLIAALERQPNLFDGRDLQIRLGLEGMAHSGERRRMLQVQTPKLLIILNDYPNIRTLKSPPNPKETRVPRASTQTLIMPGHPWFTGLDNASCRF